MSLEAKEIELLKGIIKAILTKEQSIKVYLFGSRTDDTNKKYSDVDILLDATPALSIIQLAEIKEQVEQSQSPYIFDFVLQEDLYQNYSEKICKSKTLLFNVRASNSIIR